MNKPGSHRDQNYQHNTHGSEYPAADVFAHGFIGRGVFKHDTHCQKQVYHHVNQQPNKNNFDNHSNSLINSGRRLHMGRIRFLVAIGIAIIAIAVMVRLGVWQLERMHEKEQRLASIAQKKHHGPLSLSAVATLADDPRDYPVVVSGFLHHRLRIYIDNQIENGRVGYQVVAPLSTAQGLVLVNFGWVPGTASRATLPSVNLPAALQHATGTIAIPSDNPIIRETARHISNQQLLLQQLDIPRVSKIINEPLLPFVVQLTGPAPPGFIRNWQAVVMPPEKHLGYAVQWFGLAVAATVVAFIVFFVRGKGYVRTQKK